MASYASNTAAAADAIVKRHGYHPGGDLISALGGDDLLWELVGCQKSVATRTDVRAAIDRAKLQMFWSHCDHIVSNTFFLWLVSLFVVCMYNHSSSDRRS